MKQFNDITIIGIDQGYGNMKTANTMLLLFRAAVQMAISSGRISAPKRRHPNKADFHTKKEKA